MTRSPHSAGNPAANVILGTLAFGGTTAIFLAAARWGSVPGMVAAGLLFACLLVIRRNVRRSVYIYPHVPRVTPSAVAIEPAPARQALPARIPVQWELPMEQELEVESRHLRKAVHRMFLLLLARHGNRWADEIRRELETAERKIVTGELVP